MPKVVPAISVMVGGTTLFLWVALVAYVDNLFRCKTKHRKGHQYAIRIKGKILHIIFEKIRSPNPNLTILKFPEIPDNR